MKKTLFVLLFLALLVFASNVSAQITLPKQIYKPKVWPDLRISDVQIMPTADGKFIDKITVAVQNGCSADAAASYALVTFKTQDGPNGKALLYVGNTVKGLKNGESYSQTFSIGDKKIGVGSFILVEADPYKKVVEDDENNNWRKLNPNGSPFPQTNPCQPK
jgi:hypothetical protein